MLRKLAATAAFATVMISCAVSAQTIGTGAYPFSSFDNPGFDSINLGNLNTRFSIPIVDKAGRGLPFGYVLQYEGLIWTPVVGTSTTTWVPSPSWGFNGALNGTGFAGYMTYKMKSMSCGSGGPRGSSPTEEVYYGYVYYDTFGADHTFTYQYTSECSNGSGGNTTTGSTAATDGSGYSLVNSATQIQTRNGVVITPSTSPTIPTAMSETDTNGNKISYGGSNGTFTDTLGTTALTVSGSNPVTFTYPVVNQSNGRLTASAMLYYAPYTVQSNFGCLGIVEYGATAVNLVDHIVLADGSSYAFTYENTPGTTNGNKTGRLQSITLPTGGTINYTYSGGCSSAGGIMADGTTAGLSRTTSDSSNARTYVRATVNANATSTTLTDQKGNQSVLQFTNYGGDYYETHRQVYQGSATGTPLLEAFSCYNANATPCDGLALSAPITAANMTERQNGGSELVSDNTYDTYGNLLTTSQYSGTTLLYTTGIAYNSLSEPTISITKDPSANLIAETTYGYDESTPTATSGLPQHVAATGIRGNQTSTHAVYSGSSTLSTTTAYYDTGMPVSTSTPNGTTSYGYDSTQTFVTQSNFPIPVSGTALSVSATYDASSGAALTSTGLNVGQTTTAQYYDTLLRPISITLPNTAQISYAYTPNQTSVSQNLGTGLSAQQVIIYDSYGRPIRQETSNGQSTNPYYQTDTCYDVTGLAEFVSVRYQSSGVGPEQCSGSGTSYSYDALGRVTQVKTNDGPYTIQYVNRAVLTTDVNNVQKITQYDVLGRITGICEISSIALNGVSPTACGMDISGTGFVTSYAYTLATHTTTVTQGSQTPRVFVTDALGRTTSVTEPERGNTSYGYTYNSVGLSVVRTRPRANQSNASVTTQTTTQYDSLGRVVSTTYSDGTGLPKNYYYDSLPSGQGWTQTPTYTKGLLVSTMSGVSGSSLAQTEFSYDLMGNVTAVWQCAPSICAGSLQNSRQLQFAYDLADNLTGETDSASGAIAYGLSSAGEITSITNNTYQGTGNPANLVSSVLNGPTGPTSYVMGNGLNGVRVYDGLGRSNGQWVCSGSISTNCAGGTQRYGNTSTYKGSWVTQLCDTVLNQCQNNTYDGMDHLTAVTATAPGGVGSFNYTYDRWGNRLSQTATSGGGSSPNGAVNANNQLSSVSYDAAGNQGADGISHSFTYDAEGNVIAVDGGSTAKYVYDALNNRVQTITSTGTYEYVYDTLGRRVSTWQTSNNTGVEGRIYWGATQIAFRAQNGQTFFDHQSYLGTERMRTNYQGTTAATEVSLSFGDDFNQTVTLPYSDQDTNQYAGQERDVESLSEHAQFRQYSSMQGRWMSPDPYDGSYDIYDPETLNRYSYVLNGPLSFTDPGGMMLTCPGSQTQSIWEFFQALLGLCGSGKSGTNTGGGGGSTGGTSDGGSGNNGGYGGAGGSGSGGAGGSGGSGGGGGGRGGGGGGSTGPSGSTPTNGNPNVVLFAGSIPPSPTTIGTQIFIMNWQALYLNSQGGLIPKYDSARGIYNNTPPGVITLLEDQGQGFTDKYSSRDQRGVAEDSIIYLHPPFIQQWSVGGRRVRVVIGGTEANPTLAWAVRVVVTKDGPKYYSWP